MEVCFINHYARAPVSSRGVVHHESIFAPRFKPCASLALSQPRTTYSRLRMTRTECAAGNSAEEVGTRHTTTGHSLFPLLTPVSTLLRSPAAVFAFPLAGFALMGRLLAEIGPVQLAVRLRSRAVEIVDDHVTRILLRDARSELILAESEATATAATLLHAEDALSQAVAHANELEARLSDLGDSEHGSQHAEIVAHEKEHLLGIAEVELDRERATSQRVAEEVARCSADLHRKQEIVSERQKKIVVLQHSLRDLEVGTQTELNHALAGLENVAIRLNSSRKELRAVIDSNEELKSAIQNCTAVDGVNLQSRFDNTLAALQAVRSELEDDGALGVNTLQTTSEKLKKDLRRVEEELDGMREYVHLLDDDTAVVQRLRAELNFRESAIAELRARIADAQTRGLSTRPLEFDITPRFTLSPRLATDKTDEARNPAMDHQVDTNLVTDDEVSEEIEADGRTVSDMFQVRGKEAGAVGQSAVPKSFSKSNGDVQTVSAGVEFRQVPRTRPAGKDSKDVGKMNAIDHVLKLATMETDRRGGKTSAEVAVSRALDALSGTTDAEAIIPKRKRDRRTATSAVGKTIAPPSYAEPSNAHNQEDKAARVA
jgi:hypothetical protein